MSDFDEVLAALRAGEAAAFPTETVYGLGADAGRPEAVARIFAVKGRPADHPLIVHVLDAGWLPRVAQDPPPAALALAERFWPGPLTLVLRRGPEVCAEATGGRETVAVRAPAHTLARRLLEALGRPLAAPSANRFGRVSPTTAAHVRADLPGVPVLDGGPCAVGVESTIVDLSGARPALLRPGGVPREALEEVLGPLAPPGPQAPRVPGSLESHYAPRAPLELLEPAALAEACARHAAAGRRVGLLLCGRAESPAGSPAGSHRQVALGPDPADMARGLYAALRALDEDCDVILAEAPPDEGLGSAVLDRLRRAAN